MLPPCGQNHHCMHATNLFWAVLGKSEWHTQLWNGWNTARHCRPCPAPSSCPEEREEKMAVFNWLHINVVLEQNKKFCTERFFTWNSVMNCARMNSCLSVLDGAVNKSGSVVCTGLGFCSARLSSCLANPTFPGSWKRLSWGPNGPMVSSGHTVLTPGLQRVKMFPFLKSKMIHHSHSPYVNDDKLL